MKTRILVFLPLLLISISKLYPQCDPSGYPQLLDKYWKIRQEFKDHYIVHDLDENGNLTGDGIGEWDPVNLRYDRAGYGIPPMLRIMLDRGETTDISDQAGKFCNSGGEPGVPNYLDYDGDATIYIGRYIATLSSEYSLLHRNGQEDLKRQTLNELFLALQTYRRLDMTANRLSSLYCLACQCCNPVDDPCELKKDPDLSGYSGYFLRDDVPADFYQLLNDDSSGDEWRVGGVKSVYSCFVENDLCAFRDRNKQEVSQDQIIGLLFGLAFVKRFIPEDVYVEVDGQKYFILEMAQKIANGMVRRVRISGSRSIKHPPCNFTNSECEQDGNWGPTVSAGSQVRAYAHGMFKLLDYIDPDNDVNSTLTDMAAWQLVATEFFNDPIQLVYPFVNGLLTVSDFLYEHRNDNVRMFLELMTAGNTNYGNGARKAAKKDNLFLMQHFAWAVLHGKESELESGCINNMRDILCSLICEGPCIKTNGNLSFPCENQGDGWCSGQRWLKGKPQVYDCIRIPATNSKGNGLDYMLAFNLFHLGGGMPFPMDDYYDPTNIEDNSLVKNPIIGIDGPEFLCQEQEEVFAVANADPERTYEWTVSEELQVVANDNTSITVRFAPGHVSGGWIRVQETEPISSTSCDLLPAIKKELIPAISFVPMSVVPEYDYCGRSATLRITSPTVDADDIEIVDHSLQLSRAGETEFEENRLVNNEIFFRYKSNTISNAENVTYAIQVLYANCNYTRWLIGHIPFYDCSEGCGDGTEYIQISPNPAHQDVQVELKNFASEDVFPNDHQEIDLHIISSGNGEVVRDLKMTKMSESFYLQDVPSGYYYLNATICGKAYGTGFVIQK
ncbi:MAG: hypothetical protein AAFV25_09445 [Bacteroidota bacterium]